MPEIAEIHVPEELFDKLDTIVERFEVELDNELERISAEHSRDCARYSVAILFAFFLMLLANVAVFLWQIF